MFESAISYFTYKVDNEQLNIRDFNSLFLPIKKAISDESRKNLESLKSMKNPISTNKNNNNLSLRTRTNSDLSSTNKKSKKKIQSSIQPQIIVNSNGSFKRVNGKSTQDFDKLKMKNDLLMSIISKKNNKPKPPDFQLKNTLSINSKPESKEIEDVNLPSKTLPKYTIESTCISYTFSNK